MKHDEYSTYIDLLNMISDLFLLDYEKYNAVFKRMLRLVDE